MTGRCCCCLTGEVRTEQSDVVLVPVLIVGAAVSPCVPAVFVVPVVKNLKQETTPQTHLVNYQVAQEEKEVYD